MHVTGPRIENLMHGYYKRGERTLQMVVISKLDCGTLVHVTEEENGYTGDKVTNILPIFLDIDSLSMAKIIIYLLKNEYICKTKSHYLL